MPRKFAHEVMSKIKEDIERLLRSKFIRNTWYADWLASIVPVIKKNVTLKRDLNDMIPKDEYSMYVAEMLVNSTACFDYLSMFCQLLWI